MNNIQVFMTGLVVMSAIVGLVTEAVKKILSEFNIKYYANTLAGIVSLVLSTAMGVCYVVVSGSTFTAHIVVGIVTFVFVSWLCAMVGYDKVIQTITQFKKEVNDN
jgi:hypothetical protein